MIRCDTYLHEHRGEAAKVPGQRPDQGGVREDYTIDLAHSVLDHGYANHWVRSLVGGV